MSQPQSSPRFTCLDILAAAGLHCSKTVGGERFFLCPNHEDRSPRLSINSNKDCWLCGPCRKSGNAWALAAFLAGVDPHDKAAVIAWLKEKGLFQQSRQSWKDMRDECVTASDASAEPVRRYLRNRGLTLPELVLKSLYFHPSLPYYHDDKSITHHPALVALVHRGPTAVGLFRTYLTEDGQKADVPIPRKAFGTVTGGAVVIGDYPDKRLHLAEGLETALAIYQAIGEPTWATGSAVGLQRIELPETIKEVHIWADHDLNWVGQRAACNLADQLRKNGEKT